MKVVRFQPCRSGCYFTFRYLAEDKGHKVATTTSSPLLPFKNNEPTNLSPSDLTATLSCCSKHIRRRHYTIVILLLASYFFFYTTSSSTCVASMAIFYILSQNQSWPASSFS